MKVVLDTNVLISGLITMDGLPAQVVNLLLNGRLTLLYDGRILQEYTEVLERKKFGFKKSMVDPLLDFIRNEGEYVAAEPSGKTFVDEDDRMFYEVARTAKAKCIVTGNKDHFPKDSIVKSPKEFLEMYLLENEGTRTEAT